MPAKRFLCLLSLACLAAALLALPPGPAGAQAAAASAGATIQPTRQLTIPPPQVRTWQEMEAAAALEAAGPPPPPREIPFRPTMDPALYRQLKAQAAQTRAPAPAAPLAPLAPLAATAVTSTVGFEGNSQLSLYPPDTEGAVGLNHYVEITNSHLDIYQKASPSTHTGMTLSAFFGYTTKTLFDPRVLYDRVYNRWIMSADAFAEDASTQWFFFAVSQTADPTGAYYIFKVNVSDGHGAANDVEWDFPMMGMDRNAIIFTANFFGNVTDSRMFAVAKSLLYNGPNQTLSPYLFTGLTGTLAPPVVLDDNANTYLVAAPIAPPTSPSSVVKIYTLTNSAANQPGLNGPGDITLTTPYVYPANAPQPNANPTQELDTSDNRFVNASTQIGNSLFQVHSISRSPTSQTGAFCRFYEFDTVKKTVIQSGEFYSTLTSYDFNPSIAATWHKDVYVTWTSVDTNVNAEVRVSGRLHSDSPGVISSPGLSLFQSNVALTGNSTGGGLPYQRLGDYSAVSIDPADPSGGTAWIVNEKINSASQWGSWIARLRLPVKTPLPAVDLLLLD